MNAKYDYFRVYQSKQRLPPQQIIFKENIFAKYERFVMISDY